MNFEEGERERLFRAKARGWLASQGFARSRGGRHEQDFAEPGAIDEAQAWQRRKAEAGYAGITWPKTYGGAGASMLEAQIYVEEEAAFAVPNANVFDIGIGMGGPTMLAFAGEEDKQRLVPRIVRGEDIWCQLFSEPGAGSDLAGIGTRAVQEPDTGDWIVNGQKIWTSYAQFADWGMLIARSAPDLPKHKGLTYFFIDMHSPGIAVRPIRQLAGVAEFNEVFFSDVRIPDSHRLGPVNGGWQVALTTLMHERSFGGTSTDFSSVLALARARSIGGMTAAEDGGMRRRIADAWIETEGLRLNAQIARGLLAAGDTPGPEFSFSKLISARNQREILQIKAELSGSDRLEVEDPLIQEWLNYPRGRIAGGSDEIMSNILGERVLELPAEPRIDKDVAYNRLGEIS